jgi:sulfate-transporting ATPase
MLSDGEIIEEFLVETFPALTDEQLIRATRNLQRQAYAPGEVILQEGSPPGSFYIVTKGQIEVLVEASDGDRMVVARMDKGQYFGEIELLRGGTNLATIRADWETGAEVVALEAGTFTSLLDESRSTREALERVVRQRIVENENGRNGASHA